MDLTGRHLISNGELPQHGAVPDSFIIKVDPTMEDKRLAMPPRIYTKYFYFFLVFFSIC
jgi:hypothetical protein